MSVDLSELPNKGLITGKNGVADIACRFKSVEGAIRLLIGTAQAELPKWANNTFYARVVDMVQKYHPEMDEKSCDAKINNDLDLFIPSNNNYLRGLLNKTYDKVSLSVPQNFLVGRNK